MKTTTETPATRDAARLKEINALRSAAMDCAGVGERLDTYRHPAKKRRYQEQARRYEEQAAALVRSLESREYRGLFANRPSALNLAGWGGLS
jgi:hypothetical protein